MKSTQPDMIIASEHYDIGAIEVLYWVQKMTCKMMLTFVTMIAENYNKNHCLNYMNWQCDIEREMKKSYDVKV